MHFPTEFLKVVVLFRMRVHNSTSDASVGAFPEVSNSGCPNAIRQMRNPFLFAKFGSISVFLGKIAIFSLNMYTLRSI